MSVDALDLDELFDIKEEPVDEPKTKAKKKRNEKPKENDAESHQGEPQGEPADSAPTETGTGNGDVLQPTGQPEPVSSNEHRTAVSPEGWHSNIIGTPKGRPNPYFQGIVSNDDGKQVLVPFQDVRFAQRQYYVDDITLENPTILATIYRIQGDFPNVIVRIPEEVFTASLTHPEMKHVNVYYSWVSDHLKPRRNYIIHHDKRPTEQELAAQNKHMDEIEWALKPQHQKDQLRKSHQAQYADMPEDEVVPLPVEEEPVEAVEEAEQQEE